MQQYITVTGNTQTPTVIMARIGGPPQGHSGSGSNTSTSPAAPTVSNSSSYNVPISTINITSSRDSGGTPPLNLQLFSAHDPSDSREEGILKALSVPFVAAVQLTPPATIVIGGVIFFENPPAGAIVIGSGLIELWAMRRYAGEAFRRYWDSVFAE